MSGQQQGIKILKQSSTLKLTYSFQTVIDTGMWFYIKIMYNQTFFHFASSPMKNFQKRVFVIISTFSMASKDVSTA
jgi:hypothetical protein